MNAKPADQLVATSAFVLLIFVAQISWSLGEIFLDRGRPKRMLRLPVGNVRQFRRFKSDAIGQLHTTRSKMDSAANDNCRRISADIAAGGVAR